VFGRFGVAYCLFFQCDNLVHARGGKKGMRYYLWNVEEIWPKMLKGEKGGTRNVPVGVSSKNVPFKTQGGKLNVLLTAHRNISVQSDQQDAPLYSVYCELTACTCFERYLLIFRRCCKNNNWYTASCYQGWSGTLLQPWLQPADIIRAQYTNCCLCSSSWRCASSARNMYRLSIHNKLNTKVHGVGPTVLRAGCLQEDLLM
jgi:hypothetical protein